MQHIFAGHTADVAQDALRDSTWENFPDVAAALELGDVTAACEAFLDHLTEEQARRGWPLSVSAVTA